MTTFHTAVRSEIGDTKKKRKQLEISFELLTKSILELFSGYVEVNVNFRWELVWLQTLMGAQASVT